MTTQKRQKEAAQRAAELMTIIRNQAAPPTRTIEEELAAEHRRAIAHAQQREADRRAAIERATWLCGFCGKVHEPKIVEILQDRRIVQPVEFCDCFESQAERERQAQAEREARQARHLAYLETSELWQRFNPNWPESAKAREQLHQARNKVKSWYAGQSDAGLLLAGGYGCGKSHLLRAIVSAYGGQGVSVAFYNEPEILAAILARDESSDQEIMRRCKRSKVLVLDDLGSREFNSTSAWARHALQSFYFQILERRADEDFFTLFSSNFKLSDLGPIIGDRSHDRLYAILKNRENVVGLWDVPSYRRKDF